jgi:hypothetical protein
VPSRFNWTLLLFVFVYSVLLSSIASLVLSAVQEEFAKVNFVLKHDVRRTPWGVVPRLRSAVSLPTLFHVIWRHFTRQACKPMFRGYHISIKVRDLTAEFMEMTS